MVVVKGIKDLRIELDIYLAVVFPGERIKYSGHALIANRDKCSCCIDVNPMEPRVFA